MNAPYVIVTMPDGKNKRVKVPDARSSPSTVSKRRSLTETRHAVDRNGRNEDAGNYGLHKVTHNW